jgi:hypothetical protein
MGTLLNTGAILIGGALGLGFGHWLTPTVQQRIRIGLAALTTYAGLSMIWAGIAGSTSGGAAKQLSLALLALSLGSLTGHAMRLQRGVTRLGKWAKSRYARASEIPAPMSSGALADGTGQARPDLMEGFLTCSLLFCVGPMAILGPIQDGLEGRWQVLAVKSLMDGLSTMGFVAAFGWSPMVAAIPVFLYQGAITLAAHQLEPLLHAQDLKDSVNVTGGIVVGFIALVILDLRKIPLANYLPALVWAPLLTQWFR